MAALTHSASSPKEADAIFDPVIWDIERYRRIRIVIERPSMSDEDVVALHAEAIRPFAQEKPPHIQSAKGAAEALKLLLSFDDADLVDRNLVRGVLSFLEREEAAYTGSMKSDRLSDLLAAHNAARATVIVARETQQMSPEEENAIVLDVALFALDRAHWNVCSYVCQMPEDWHRKTEFLFSETSRVSDEDRFANCLRHAMAGVTLPFDDGRGLETATA